MAQQPDSIPAENVRERGREDFVLPVGSAPLKVEIRLELIG
jgi:hypothetical protein